LIKNDHAFVSQSRENACRKKRGFWIFWGRLGICSGFGFSLDRSRL